MEYIIIGFVVVLIVLFLYTYVRNSIKIGKKNKAKNAESNTAKEAPNIQPITKASKNFMQEAFKNKKIDRTTEINFEEVSENEVDKQLKAEAIIKQKPTVYNNSNYNNNNNSYNNAGNNYNNESYGNAGNNNANNNDSFNRNANFNNNYFTDQDSLTVDEIVNELDSNLEQELNLDLNTLNKKNKDNSFEKMLKEDNDLAEEFKNLSAEMKAFIIANVIKNKND